MKIKGIFKMYDYFKNLISICINFFMGRQKPESDTRKEMNMSTNFHA